ncbi:MAG: DDE-type integrase/transposase/recombinase [Desulfobacteraceae bacterium]|jgi:transposase InsO family protein
MDENDKIVAKALLRYQIISAYLAADPPRGQRRRMLEQLAAKTWMLESGQVVSVKAETIRYWLRRYRRGGFEALKDKPRCSGIGRRALSDELITTACRLKREVPERTLDRIIAIMENMQMAPPGLVRRSTLHRALAARGLSARKLKIADRCDLDRFEADYANDLWQSDMLQGPWLADPAKPGKMRRTYLYAFLDDASRLLLYGRFFFKGDLPALELVFKRSLQRYGRPVRVYYDNAKVYRSNHMRLICAELGIHRPIFTQPYRPMGHGKVESFNRFCITNFIAEVKASRIRTLDQLNEAFVAWIEEEYNQRNHSELGTSPKNRWMKDVSRIHYLEEEKIRVAFLWREVRTADKAGVVQLFNRKYKVSPQLARKKLELRYDPERLDQIEIFVDGAFRQRAKPLQIGANRTPKQLPILKEHHEHPPTDYLGYLTKKHQEKIHIKAAAGQKTDRASLKTFLAIVSKRIATQVFDAELATDFYNTYGPFETKLLETWLDNLLCNHPTNLHLSFYLEYIQHQLIQGQSADQ